jgi:hypothetical protein
MGTMTRRRVRWSVSITGMLLAASASAQTGSPGQGGSPPSGPQTEKPQSPETAPARPPNALSSPLPQLAVIGPSREIKLGDYTWFRFGAQVQAWYRATQDRLTVPNLTGSYASNFYCRRCRFFATGSVVQNVFFNVLFEAGNYGIADATTGAKSWNPINPPAILDAYGQVKIFDWLWISGGNILLPLTRNGTQPTTTYLSIDNANVDTSPILQGNTLVIRDLGFQLNGFFLDNHLEYRLGIFQGSRQAAIVTGTPPATTTLESASHNGPRFVSYLLMNFWDPEVGYVNGGHYYGTKKVLGLMANFDTQVFRSDGPALLPPGVTTGTVGVGQSKNAYYGLSGAAFINYPLAGRANPRGGDEFVGLVQFGYYDGGLRQAANGALTNFGTYPTVLKQTNWLVEAAYYAHAARFSIFGKWERRNVDDQFSGALKTTFNQNWAAGGLKYYVGPANTMNFGLQYERIINYSAPSVQQSGTNNITFQMQTILY